MNILEYFFDPVLQAPTVGSVLMCFSSALVGVVTVLRKRSLLGEALSHAAYPGVVFSALVMAIFFPKAYEWLPFTILLGGGASALLGLWLIETMERKWRVTNDAALCFVLSVFFGVGVLFASQLQFSHALWYKMIHIFLYGQVATMTNVHIWIYLFLALIVMSTVFFLYRPIEILIFDREFANSIGIRTRTLDGLLFLLIVLAVIVGVRSVGVVLMAGMLIAPAVAARQWTERLGPVFILAGLIGAISGFLGNYLSVELSYWGIRQGWQGGSAVPTGPMILLSAAFFAFFSLLFSPKKGLILRWWRMSRFQRKCRKENLLKFLWRRGEGATVSYDNLSLAHDGNRMRLRLLLRCLKKEGWIEGGDTVQLTKDGWQRATQIVRFHRLWEAYLVSLGQGVEKVHGSAEEMEHIITPELERALSELLGHPIQDPHDQPIPSHD